MIWRCPCTTAPCTAATIWRCPSVILYAVFIIAAYHSQHNCPDSWGDQTCLTSSKCQRRTPEAMIDVCRTHYLFIKHDKLYFMDAFVCNSYSQIWVDLHTGSDLNDQHMKCHEESAATVGRSKWCRRWQKMCVLRVAALKVTAFWKSVLGKGVSINLSSASQRKRASSWIHSKRKWS